MPRNTAAYGLRARTWQAEITPRAARSFHKSNRSSQEQEEGYKQPMAARVAGRPISGLRAAGPQLADRNHSKATKVANLMDKKKDSAVAEAMAMFR